MQRLMVGQIAPTGLMEITCLTYPGAAVAAFIPVERIRPTLPVGLVSISRRMVVSGPQTMPPV